AGPRREDQMDHLSKNKKQAESAAGALVVFAKAPIPGQVKTRLCPPLTPDEAATVHGSFVIDTLERTKAAVSKFRLPVDRYLACAPTSTVAFFKIMEERQTVGLLDQEGDDLGARMNRVFESLFARGYRRVLIVGTDVPSLPLDTYRQAVQLLDRSDVVLGPASDGGYYLIGLTRPVPALFHQIPWSTDRVLALTQEKAAELNLIVGLLPEWRDVDTIDDLKMLIDTSRLDARKPKQEQSFSTRTAGALQLLATRLNSRTSRNS
ncbi:MAG TPA: TIGR04282 family arsenosugar biosynthesis glycosyltransferase, partial [Nitrospira sp.]|nr:TIGR04282 family arsenosugar biosynthesis glycosyltransferase [Nitrospira sp.]